MEPPTGNKHILFRPNNNSYNYAGVVLFVKPNIKFKQITNAFTSDTVAIQIETTTGPVIVVVNYSPPARISPIPRPIWMSRHNCLVYLMADLNAHHTLFDYRTEQRGRDLFNMWLSTGRLRVIGPNIGTYITNTRRKTKPDLLLTNRAC